VVGGKVLIGREMEVAECGDGGSSGQQSVVSLGLSAGRGMAARVCASAVVQDNRRVSPLYRVKKQDRNRYARLGAPAAASVSSGSACSKPTGHIVLKALR
jgi:hypothetical protein